MYANDLRYTLQNIHVMTSAGNTGDDACDYSPGRLEDV